MTRRQKHCSYCYGRGHTRPTCPEIKKQIESDPNGYYARVEKAKEEHRANRPKVARRCSYCKETGHNKKTCNTLKIDRIEYRVKNKKFAKAFIAGCKDFGLYPGALLELVSSEEIKADSVTYYAVEYRQRQLERDRQAYGNLAMVVGFTEWNINYDLSDENKKYLGGRTGCVKVRFPNGRKAILPLPREFRHIAHNSEECKNGFWKMGCSVNASKIEDCFSAEWKSGDLSVNRQLGLDS